MLLKYTALINRQPLCVLQVTEVGTKIQNEKTGKFCGKGLSE